MAKNHQTSKVIDALLQTIMLTSGLAVAVVAPNAVGLLDKPLRHYFEKLDSTSRDRCFKKYVRYARNQGLITEDYQNGLILTKQGKRRLDIQVFREIKIPIPEEWDRKWRLILFDIPSSKNVKRVQLTRKLSCMGLQLLQQSVWIYPFACRLEIEKVCHYYGVETYVSYIETDAIDNEHTINRRFRKLIPNM